MANITHHGAIPVSDVAERPSSSLRTDWIVILLSLWFLGGLFVDGWAHNNLSSSLETFFTPWHAVFYSGFMAVAGFHLWTMRQNHSKGHSWLNSLPRGYDLSLWGLIIFSFGGLGDMLWHTFLGIETGIEALFSPTHLLLATGIMLLVAGPMRSTSYRLQTNTSDWRTLFPLVLSMTFTLSLFTFMGQFAYPPGQAWIMVGVYRPGIDGQMRQILGMMGGILHAVMLMGILLSVIKRWTLPVGTITFMMTINVGLMSVMQQEFLSIMPAIITGIVGDGLLIALRPSAQRPNQFRLFAFLIPCIFYTLFVINIEYTIGSWWSIHMLAGLPIVSGMMGFLISYLVLTPPSLAQVE